MPDTGRDQRNSNTVRAPSALFANPLARVSRSFGDASRIFCRLYVHRSNGRHGSAQLYDLPCVATLDVREAARRQDLGTACPRSPLCNADVSPAGIRILVLLSPPPRSRRGHPCRVVRAFVLVRDHFIWLASPRGLSYLVPFISQCRAKRLIYAETR